MKKIIVLDRDGVINQDSPEYVKSPNEWHPIPGSLEAIVKLNTAGFKVVVATNQSGIARGHFSPDTLAKIHQKMSLQVEKLGGRLAGIFICPHGPQDNCDCRKPKPGLLLQIATKFAIKPEDLLVIGDSMRDLLAASACGAAAILVKTGNGKKTSASQQLAVPVFDDLEHAVDYIIENES
jgi:D-glycero-D-manno-heptose 1,7-bisphosphate phosphatase